MRKLSFGLVLLLSFGILFTSYSNAETLKERKTIEQDLKTIGVLIGGDGVDSSSKVTRQEMVIVLIRMLGKEKIAQTNYSNSYIPFNDVAEWAKPYVAYAYSNGLTKGVSATKFDGTGLVDVNQASTFMLRVLNYDEGTDYSWNTAFDAAVLLKIVDPDKDDISKNSFIRSNLNTLVKDTLLSNKKNSKTLLINDLVDEGAIDANSLSDTTTFSEDIITKEIEELEKIDELKDDKTEQDKDDKQGDNKASENTDAYIVTKLLASRMYLGDYYDSFTAINMEGDEITFLTKDGKPLEFQSYNITSYQLEDEKDLYLATTMKKASMLPICTDDMYIKSINSSNYRLTLTDGTKYYISPNSIVTGNSNSVKDLCTLINANNKNTSYEYTYKINSYILGNQDTMIYIDVAIESKKLSNEIDLNNLVFGTYVQSGTSKSPIEWKVLKVDKNNNKALIISKYYLDKKAYNTGDVDIKATWKDCTLRKWLNSDFLNEAFDDIEKERILDTRLDDVGTTDKVFLLNADESDRYLSEEERAIVPVDNYNENLGRDWTGAWLRTAGCVNHADTINLNGIINESFFWFNYINYPNLFVRPALWINIE